MRCGVIGAVLSVVMAQPAVAYFEANAVGARALALGNNFVSVADDATALYWNPAGLVRLPRHEALFTLEHAPQLDDVRRGFAALAVHSRYATVGVGWHAAHLDDALREDMVYLSVSRLLVRRSLGAFIASGVTVKMAHVGVDASAAAGVPGLSSDATRFAVDVGALLSPIPNVTVGATGRNLGQPRFDLLPGGTSTELSHEFDIGVSFRWRQDAQLHWSRTSSSHRGAENKLGIEVGVGESLSMQLGVARARLTGGMGVRWKRWGFDASFQAHDTLGLWTRVGVKLGFGAERDGLGGAYDDF